MQALLPLWLEFTDREILASALDDHLRLPSAVHHNSLAMAALNFVAALALIHVFRSASDLPARLSYAVAATARRWWDGLLYVIGLVLRLTGAALPQPGHLCPLWPFHGHMPSRFCCIARSPARRNPAALPSSRHRTRS